MVSSGVCDTAVGCACIRNAPFFWTRFYTCRCITVIPKVTAILYKNVYRKMGRLKQLNNDTLVDMLRPICSCRIYDLKVLLNVLLVLLYSNIVI